MSLFVTCVVDALYPQVGVSTVKLLRRLGVEVDFPPGQVCCGQPAYNSGHTSAARRSAAQLVESLSASDYIVTPSGSCASFVAGYYRSLFGDNDGKAAAVSERTYELSQFVVDVLGITALPGRFPGRVVYHASCHMTRLLGVRSAPLQLLAGLEGLELLELPYAHECCGFGGTFSVKMADLSVAMADTKIDHVLSTGADYLVGSDMGCLMHLGGRLQKRGLPIKVLHTAEVLERATRSLQTSDWLRKAESVQEDAS